MYTPKLVLNQVAPLARRHGGCRCHCYLCKKDGDLQEQLTEGAPTSVQAPAQCLAEGDQLWLARLSGGGFLEGKNEQ
jgi:hypothetical protein